MKYHEELNSVNTGESSRRSQSQLQAFNIEGDPALEFNAEFLAQWKNTSNYGLFQKLTSDALLYSVVEPRHPCAGGLTIEDIQRRLAQQVSDLHLDERVREGREILNRHLTTGQKKVTAALNSFWADIDAMREAQRKRNEERAATAASQSSSSPRPSMSKEQEQQQEFPSHESSIPPKRPNSMSSAAAGMVPSVDLAQTQASVSSVGAKASTYLSSWASWAGEKRKEWQDKKSAPSSTGDNTSTKEVASGSASIFDADDTAREEHEETKQQSSSNDEKKDVKDEEEDDDLEGHPQEEQQRQSFRNSRNWKTLSRGSIILQQSNDDDEFEPVQTMGQDGTAIKQNSSGNKNHTSGDDDDEDGVSGTEFYDTEKSYGD